MAVVRAPGQPPFNSWVELNANIHLMTEDECHEALLIERRTKNRKGFVNRYYCRFSRLRMTRERAAFGLPDNRAKDK